MKYQPGMFCMLLGLLLIPVMLEAQLVTISGKVVDGNSGEALEFATVSLERAEDSILVGELNDIYQLGETALAPSATALNKVTVAARGEITSAGLEKATSDMEDMLSRSGGSVLDALRGLPGITVSQEIEGKGFRATYEHLYETQVFRLGYKHQF